MAFAAVRFAEGSSGAVADGVEKERSLWVSRMFVGEEVQLGSLSADAIEG